MKALKCDRCGKFYVSRKKKDSAMLEGINIERIGITEEYDIGYDDDGKTFDICPNCAKSFVRWFKEVEMDIAKEAMTENELHSVVE